MRYAALALGLLACGPGGDTNTTAGGTTTGETTTGPTSPTEWPCTLDDQAEPFWADQVGCLVDWDKIASTPLDASIPGARSAKTVIDTLQENKLYYINSQLYPIHWEFAFEHLSADDGLPFVPDLGTFNLTEYSSPDRRFILGAITYYEEPNVWAYEIAPYDTADADMIMEGYRLARDNGFFGSHLYYHPNSSLQEEKLGDLDDDISIITTDELFDGITYAPLNLGTTTGLLTFHTAEEVDGSPIYFREIAVLDRVPNDIGIVAGIITDEFQTPLSHINVLSVNRGTPNMSLIGAWEDPDLRALEGKWVELTVAANEWTVKEITLEEADAWWEDNKPEPLDVSDMDLSVTEITDAEDILDLDNLTLAEAIDESIPAFGGKATHFGGLVHIGDDVPVPDGFSIPNSFYNQFMEDNGFWERVEGWLDDPDDPNDPFDEQFYGDPEYKQEQLEQLQADMLEAPIDPVFLADLEAKLIADYPGVRMRFRSSTNAEDLGNFTGAGLYTSNSGSLDDPDESVEDAVRGTWSSVWNPRAYDEREYYSINHRKVGMSLLCHRSFPNEEANGVAITGNIFDTSGLDPAFYINAQVDGWSVVLPEFGVKSDSLLYYYSQAGKPIVYLDHSNLIPEGWTVLTNAQVEELGTALEAIRLYFLPVYGDDPFYAMDTEFKFEDDAHDDGRAHLFMKQARPFPGLGNN